MTVYKPLILGLGPHKKKGGLQSTAQTIESSSGLCSPAVKQNINLCEKKKIELEKEDEIQLRKQKLKECCSQCACPIKWISSLGHLGTQLLNSGK